MMALWHGNIFLISGLGEGNSYITGGIPSTKVQQCKVWFFLLVWTSCGINSGVGGDLRSYDADMTSPKWTSVIYVAIYSNTGMCSQSSMCCLFVNFTHILQGYCTWLLLELTQITTWLPEWWVEQLWGYVWINYTDLLWNMNNWNNKKKMFISYGMHCEHLITSLAPGRLQNCITASYMY